MNPAQDLSGLFAHCNQRYFNHSIKPSHGFKLVQSRCHKLFGCFTYCQQTHTDWSIHLADWLLDHPLAALNTMTHEMLHMLAHQRFRETGDPFYLDQQALPGQPFVNQGHGAYFLSEMERLNRRFGELQLAVKSVINDTLFDYSKMPPARLMLVTIDHSHGRGMIYRLHEKARLDWTTLRATARQLHGLTSTVDNIRLIQVAGHLAVDFPLLDKNNQPPATMKPLGLKGYLAAANAMLEDSRTQVFRERAMAHSALTR